MSEKNWEKCECGVIERMLADKSSRRRWLGSMLLATLGAGTAAVYVAERLYGNTFQRSAPATGPQPLACEAVHQRLQDLVDNRVRDAYLRGMISRHLFTCPACQQAYRSLINDEDFSCEGDA